MAHSARIQHLKNKIKKCEEEIRAVLEPCSEEITKAHCLDLLSYIEDRDKWRARLHELNLSMGVIE